MDKTSGGSVTRTLTYYPVAGAAVRIDGTLYYVLKDHLGSASVVTNASGTIVGEQRYYPFGETRLTTESMYTDKLFTGQREMRRPEPVEGAGLGIYHFGARFYSPKIGRFLSADTIVPGAGNPQAYNRYSYVLNSPLNYNDPTGHMCSDPDDPTPSCDGSGSYPSNTRPLGDSPVRPAPPPGPEHNPSPGGGGGELPATVPTVTLPSTIPPPVTSTPAVTPTVMPPILPTPTVTSPGTPPPSFTQASLTQNAVYSVPHWCEVMLDCVLSAISVLASGLTLVPEPHVAGAAFAVDVVVTVWAVVRTNEDYHQGEISQTRQWILNGTGILGLVPSHFGLGLSVLNLLFTATGIPE